MIYTTYFAKIRALPKDVIPIAICAKPPTGWAGAEYKKLAPKFEDLLQWKNNHDNELYIVNYYNHVLCHLNPIDVVDELFKIAKSQEIALVCYEKSDDFCHRHIVRKWLKDYGGYIVKEFKI